MIEKKPVEKKRKIRVLQCTPVLDMGGIQTMIMRLYRSIDPSEFSFDFLTCGGDREYYYEKEIRNLGGKIYRVPQRSVSFLQHHLKMYQLIRKEHYDVIHFHAINAVFTALEVLTARLAGAKHIIVHSHSTSDWRKNKHEFLNKLAYAYMRHAVSLKLSCSKAASDWLFGKRTETEIFPLPVLSREFLFSKEKRNAWREEYGFIGKKIYVHVGRFGEEKNHAFMLRVFQLIVEKEPEAVLFFLGDGPLRSDMEKLAQELKIADHVVFWGNVNDVAVKLNASDVFWLPSLYEGFPTVVLEAQAAGLPCIVSDQVTDEICLTKLVEQWKLSDGENFWAQNLLKVKPENNRESFNSIIADQYDIDVVSDKLKKIYYSLV